MQDITPHLRRSWIDIHVVGLRNLLKAEGQKVTNVRKPFLQFDVASQSYGDSAKTAQSRVPSPNNPNFLDRLIIDTKLPEDPLYAPALEIKCYDARVGGTVVLGTASIALSAKEPWNGSEYMPPRQHKIVQAVIKIRKDIARRKLEIANAEAAARKKQFGGEGAYSLPI